MMNKKISAVAAAVLACCVTVSSAADFQVYGSIDNSLSYIKAKGQDGLFSMYASNDLSSKIGFTGTEKLTDTTYIRFKLENGFSPDTGALAVKDTLFNRESSVVIGGSWGELGLGRFGTLFTGIGTYGQIGKMGMNPCGTNWHDGAMSGAFTTTGQVSNALVYQVSPTENLTLIGLYSNGAEEQDWADEDHLYQAAVRWKLNDLTLGAIYSAIDYGNQSTTSSRDSKISHNFLLIGNKAFGATRFYLAYQHVENARQLGGGKAVFKASDLFTTAAVRESRSALDSDAYMIGLKHPVLGGSLAAKFMYLNARWNGEQVRGRDTDGNRYVVAAKYKYDLSKRTDVYVFASWAKGDGMFRNTAKTEATATRWMTAVGLSHRF